MKEAENDRKEDQYADYDQIDQAERDTDEQTVNFKSVHTGRSSAMVVGSNITGSHPYSKRSAKMAIELNYLQKQLDNEREEKEILKHRVMAMNDKFKQREATD